MSAELRVAAAQPLCVPHDVTANVAAHADAVRRAGARVVVFPELSLTGYELDAGLLDVGDERLRPLVDACREAGAVALAGAPVSGPAIAMLVVDGTGISIGYRKVWVDPSEAGRFVPGPAAEVIEVDGWRLGAAICRDTGIVRHTEDLGRLGVDGYVAGTLMHDHQAAEQDRRARVTAAALGVPVVIASFAGSTGEGYDRACGRSGIWTPDGAAPVVAGPAPGEIVTATLHR